MWATSSTTISSRSSSGARGMSTGINPHERVRTHESQGRGYSGYRRKGRGLRRYDSSTLRRSWYGLWEGRSSNWQNGWVQSDVVARGRRGSEQSLARCKFMKRRARRHGDVAYIVRTSWPDLHVAAVACRSASPRFVPIVAALHVTLVSALRERDTVPTTGRHDKQHGDHTLR